MRFGINSMTRGPLATRNAYMTMTDVGERYGYDFISVNDHVVVPATIASHYPYSDEGTWSGAASGYCLDQLATLSFLAGCTRSLRLLTSVMVVPHRPAILAAKTLSTIDVLSKGRLTVGIGVGWLAEEMAALGAPPYARRGVASDEFVAAFRSLWTETTPMMDGEFVTLRDVIFEPKPTQKPHPPIWVGGEGAAARRRAGRLCDGWYPTIRNPREPLDTPPTFAAALADVRRHAEAAGRNPADVDVALFAPGYYLGAPRSDAAGKRIAFTGSAEQIAEDARAYRAAGVRHIVVSFESNDLQETLDRAERLARDVVPLAV